MKLYASVSSDSYYTREIDTTDSWDIGDQVLSNIAVEVYQAPDKEYGVEVTPAADGTVCVLVEHYRDGCTFGSSEYTDLKSIFTDEVDAQAFANKQKIDHGYFGRHIKWLYFTEKVPS